MNLTYLFQLFMDSRKRGTGNARKKSGPATLHIYTWTLQYFLDYLAERGVVNYEEIRRVHIVDFLDVLDKKEKDGSWRPATTLQILRSLKTLFLFVDTDDDCKEAGLKGHQRWLPPLGKTPRRTDLPQTSDLKMFKNTFRTATRWDLRDYTAVCLMMGTGIRVGEVCNLRLDHVLLDDGIMIVNGKTGPRPIPLTAEVVRLLKAWLKKRNSYKYAGDSPYVFISKRKEKMHISAFGNRLRKHCQKHNLPRITSHTFRHAFCTHFLKKGGDMEKLRLITGHTTFEMLQNYLHLAKVGGSSVRSELERVNLLRDV